MIVIEAAMEPKPHKECITYETIQSSSPEREWPNCKAAI